jgi:transcriptional regulator with XRE-family HTH domain
MSASQLLRSAREASDLTQVELSRRSNTSQPNVSFIESGSRIPTVDTLERLLQASRHRLITIPTIGPDAPATASRIEIALAGDNSDAALRAFIDYSDALARETGTTRIALTLARPARTGSAVWDSALAALVDFWLSHERSPKPDWIAQSDRFLKVPTEPVKYPLAPPLDRANVPPQFLERNVLLELGTLESV